MLWERNIDEATWDLKGSSQSLGSVHCKTNTLGEQLWLVPLPPSSSVLVGSLFCNEDGMSRIL